MKTFLKLRFLPFCSALLVGSAAFSQSTNPLSGRPYREISELKEMHDYESSGGCVVGQGPDYFHTIGVYSNGKNTVIVLERTYNPEGGMRYSVLDTVNLGPVDPMNHISFYDCELNGVSDNTITAVHDEQQGAYYTRIRRAWKADLNTLQLVSVPDVQLRQIRCPQPGDEEMEDIAPMTVSGEIPAEVYEAEGHAGNAIHVEPLTRKELRKQKRKLKKLLRDTPDRRMD